MAAVKPKPYSYAYTELKSCSARRVDSIVKGITAVVDRDPVAG